MNIDGWLHNRDIWNNWYWGDHQVGLGSLVHGLRGVAGVDRGDVGLHHSGVGDHGGVIGNWGGGVVSNWGGCMVLYNGGGVGGDNRGGVFDHGDNWMDGHNGWGDHYWRVGGGSGEGNQAERDDL